MAERKQDVSSENTEYELLRFEDGGEGEGTPFQPLEPVITGSDDEPTQLSETTVRRRERIRRLSSENEETQVFQVLLPEDLNGRLTITNADGSIMVDEEDEDDELDPKTIILPQVEFARLLHRFFQGMGMESIADFRKSLERIISFQDSHNFVVRLLRINGRVENSKLKAGQLSPDELPEMSLYQLKAAIFDDLETIERYIKDKWSEASLTRAVKVLCGRFLYGVALEADKITDEFLQMNVENVSFVLKEHVLKIARKEAGYAVSDEDPFATRPNTTIQRRNH